MKKTDSVSYKLLAVILKEKLGVVMAKQRPTKPQDRSLKRWRLLIAF